MLNILLGIFTLVGFGEILQKAIIGWISVFAVIIVIILVVWIFNAFASKTNK